MNRCCSTTSSVCRHKRRKRLTANEFSGSEGCRGIIRVTFVAFVTREKKMWTTKDTKAKHTECTKNPSLSGVVYPQQLFGGRVGSQGSWAPGTEEGACEALGHYRRQNAVEPSLEVAVALDAGEQVAHQLAETVALRSQGD